MKFYVLRKKPFNTNQFYAVRENASYGEVHFRTETYFRYLYEMKIKCKCVGYNLIKRVLLLLE